MILCVDLDDTLALSGKTIIDYAIKFDKEVLKRTTTIKKVTNCSDYYYFARMLNWNRQDLIKFFEYCYPNYLKDIKIKYGTRKYLKLLKKLNVKIYIVTSRREIRDDIVEKITIEWLKKNKLEYDKLYINIENKADLLGKLKPDYYIDDSLKNCDSVHALVPNTRIFLMNTIYNKKLNARYERINNIKNFYDILKEGGCDGR